MDFSNILKHFKIAPHNHSFHLGLTIDNAAIASSKHFVSRSPINGSVLGEVNQASPEDYENLIQQCQTAFLFWRKQPAPVRGEIIRQIGQEFRNHKTQLGQLVSIEMGKSLQEGLGEVQEIIDICDFAVGLSRQLYGLSMHSERPQHRMYEQWHPLGIVGIISAFNFPVAVWAWNSMIAAVCGNVSLWKPSEKTPLSALACMNIISKVLHENKIPPGVFSMIYGDGQGLGEKIAKDKRIPLISATGSTRMGKRVAELVGNRLGKSLLELGGNNAIILTPHSRLELAIPAVVFGAVGTAGQRCTSTRRLIVHEGIFDTCKAALIKAYTGLKIGNPLDSQNHLGPLIDKEAVTQMQNAIKQAKAEGGEVLFGGEVLSNLGSECYVRPALIEMPNQSQVMQTETFAPILYLLKFKGDLSMAIELQNSVQQGLSSALFSDNLLETELFLSAEGSDCGIANINIGTSGAEIGGAFGGEKETGGGRESGSDSWKAYMRRQTNTINYGRSLPLAQGIKFEI